MGSVVGQLSSCWHSVTTDALSNGKQLVIGISCYWDFWRKSVVGCNLAAERFSLGFGGVLMPPENSDSPLATALGWCVLSASEDVLAWLRARLRTSIDRMNPYNQSTSLLSSFTQIPTNCKCCKQMREEGPPVSRPCVIFTVASRVKRARVCVS